MRTLATCLLGACAALSTACGGGSMSLPQLPRVPMLGGDDEMSYAQVQSVQRGLTAAQVRDAFGEPKRISRRADGTVERMEYPARDAAGSSEQLLLDFDARERLVTKTFTGKVLRP
jgi:hypothetical protein